MNCLIGDLGSLRNHVNRRPEAAGGFSLTLQRVLGEATWEKRLTAVDLRALTPLIYGHVSPYGTFLLDMNECLDIELPMDTLPGMDAEVTTTVQRKSGHSPRSARAEAQQLALFNADPQLYRQR